MKKWREAMRVLAVLALVLLSLAVDSTRAILLNEDPRGNDSHDRHRARTDLAVLTHEPSATPEPRRVYVVATADGRVYGIEGNTGEQLWSFHSGRPLFSASSKPGSTASSDDHPLLIPGRDGSLYAYLTASGMLKKLPSSIKDIVNNSPFLATDGTLFVGSKDSQIFTLGLDTGSLSSVHSTRGLSTQLVPVNPDDDAIPDQLFVMRTDYTVRAIDHKSGEELWNATISEFSSDQSDESDVALMASLQPNGIHAVDMKQGMRLWNMKFPSPVVSVYQVSYDTMMRRAFLRMLETPFVISHKHFLHSLSSPKADSDGVFIVEHEGGLIAFPNPTVVSRQEGLPAAVKDRIFSLPKPEDVKTGGQLVPAYTPARALRDQSEVHPMCLDKLFDDGDDDTDGDLHYNNSIILDDGKECLVKGLHFIDETSQVEIERLGTRTDKPAAVSTIEVQEPRIFILLDRLGIGGASVVSSMVTIAVMLLLRYVYSHRSKTPSDREEGFEEEKVETERKSSGKRRKKSVKLQNMQNDQDRTKEEQTSGGEEEDNKDNESDEIVEGNTKEEESDSSSSGSSTQNEGEEEDQEEEEASSGEGRRTKLKKGTKSKSIPVMPSEKKASSMSDDGILRVGQLEIHTNKVLGYGSSGTVVYEGLLHGRKVAVKRMLADFYQLAYREISLLLVADEHPNVVSYYAKEEDDQFIYLALSQCVNTLGEFVENKQRKVRVKGKTAGKPASIADHPLPPVTAEMKKLLLQMVGGLAHLHSLDIVHRDLKPHNVLLDRNNCIKISDMGLAKKLDKDQSSFTASGGSKGTLGWQAPEILAAADEAEERGRHAVNDSDDARKRIRVTKKVDIFSMGCLLYYVLTGGLHPFGPSYEREYNIRKSSPNLHPSLSPEARDLVFSMIEHNPTKRPTAHEIALHPFFWSDSKKLLFLKDASDRLEIEKPTEKIVVEFEDQAYYRILQRRDWMRVLDRKLIDDLGRYRKYNGNLVRDLLRVIRNKSHHHRDLAPDVRALLGELPGPFLNYFMKQFPNLLIVTYKHLRKYCEREEAFKQYYRDAGEVS